MGRLHHACRLFIATDSVAPSGRGSDAYAIARRFRQPGHHTGPRPRGDADAYTRTERIMFNAPDVAEVRIPVLDVAF